MKLLTENIILGILFALMLASAAHVAHFLGLI
jgi:hypothetical protein